MSKRRENILSNWSVLLDDYNTSGQDFFDKIKDNIKAREVPGYYTSIIKRSESGALSAKREYFRIVKGDLIFDVGASPYGKGFFFSWWLVKRGGYPWLHTLLFVIFAVALLFGLAEGDLNRLGYRLDDGDFWLMFVGGLVALFLVYGILGKTGIWGPEEYIAEAPLLGRPYAAVFIPVTYHSLDLAAMYQESIRRAVNDAINQTLESDGKPLLTPEQKRFRSVFADTQRSIDSKQRI